MTEQQIKAQLDESISNAFKLQAETMKLNAEGALLHKKAKWYELVIFCGAGITIGLALAKVFGS